MRTALLAAAFAAALASSAAAQAPAASPRRPLPPPDGVTVGVLGALVFSEISGDSIAPLDDSRTNFAVGLTAVIPLSPLFSLEPDLLYVRKGASGALPAGNGALAGGFRYDVIELPVLLRAALQPGRDFRPVLFAGPMVAKRVKCSLDAAFGAVAAAFDCGPNIRSLDYGVVFGVGADVPKGSNTLSFMARYDVGLRDLDADPAPAAFRSRAFLLTVGWGFRLR